MNREKPKDYKALFLDAQLHVKQLAGWCRQLRSAMAVLRVENTNLRENLKPKRYLTTREAAQYLGLSAGWIAQLRSRGEGPPYVAVSTKNFMYDVKDLDAWMQKSKRVFEPRPAPPKEPK